MSRARHLLARPFCILGTPGRGRGYGSKYTVPTINLARYEELVPKDGVYITWTRVGSERFDSVTNVGNRPTFGAELFAIETHLLNFHPLELLPETELEICFLERLRDEIKFPSVEALREQIATRREKSAALFSLAAQGQRRQLTPLLVRQIAKLHGEFAVHVDHVDAVVDGVDFDQAHGARFRLHRLENVGIGVDE